MTELTVENPPSDLIPLIASAAVVAVLGLWVGLRLGRWYQNRRQAVRESERFAFREVKVSMRSRDPQAISASIMRWLDRIDPGDRPARLDLFLKDHGDQTTRAAATVLSQSLAAGEDFTETRALAHGLKKARGRLLHRRHTVRRAKNVLPELNG